MPGPVTWGLEVWEGLDVIPYGGLNNVDTLGVFFDENGKLLVFLMESSFASVEVNDSIALSDVVAPAFLVTPAAETITLNDVSEADFATSPTKL